MELKKEGVGEGRFIPLGDAYPEEIKVQLEVRQSLGGGNGHTMADRFLCNYISCPVELHDSSYGSLPGWPYA